MKRRLAQLVKCLWITISLVVLLGSHSPVLAAPSAEQRKLIQSGIYLLDIDEGGGCSVTETIATGTLPTVIPEPYNGAFTAAGNAYHVSPLLIAALFTEEHFTNQNVSQIAGSWKGLLKAQPDPNKGWATSPDQAMGPFQFIPSSWQSLGVDADKNGKKDVENLLDASYGAANYAKTDGATADKSEAVWHKFADGYSGHTAGYADRFISYVDYYKTGGSAAPTAGTSTASDSSNISTSSSGCDSGGGDGAVAGNLAATAVGYAWNDYPTHGFTSKDSTPAYDTARNKVQGKGADPTDCGIFVATVVISSGVDKDWPHSGSGGMRAYAKSHPDKWTTFSSFKTTSDLKAGDILVNSDHIYMYVGKQKDGKSVAEASLGDHVPEIDNDPYPSQDGENFTVVRHKD